MHRSRPFIALLLLLGASVLSVVILLVLPSAAPSAQSVFPASAGTNLTPIPTRKAKPTLSQPTPFAAQGVIPGVISKHSDLPYASIKNVDPRLLSLDVYTTQTLATSGDRPVMIYLHGGGWSAGDKSEVGHKPDFFVAAGYVFVSINYRLCPKAAFPAHVEDAAMAIAWVSQHIRDYGGDPEKITLMGHSAGGHLVTLVGSDPRYLRAVGLDLNAIKAIVALDSGAYDLARFAKKCDSKLPDPYGATFGQDPATWQAASPVTYVTSTAPIPPMVVIYSGDPAIGSKVPRSEIAGDFVAVLRGAGKRAELVGAPEETHSQINDNFGLPGEHVSEAALKFLNEVLENN